MAGRVRVYIACSVDGFIAGPGNDLSWLPQGPDDLTGPTDPRAVQYEAFMADVGAMLMGRGTYDVVAGFDGPWPYGDTPVVVATSRPLDPLAPTVHAASGDITRLVGRARELAAGRDVYLDGGNLIRQALDAELVDELIITMVPVVLGAGHALFAGVDGRHTLTFDAHYDMGGMVQLVARPTSRRSTPE